MDTGGREPGAGLTGVHGAPPPAPTLGQRLAVDGRRVAAARTWQPTSQPDYRNWLVPRLLKAIEFALQGFDRQECLF